MSVRRLHPTRVRVAWLMNEKIEERIAREFSRLSWLIAGVTFLLLVTQMVVIVYLTRRADMATADARTALWISALAVLSTGIVALIILQILNRRVREATLSAVGDELVSLRAESARARSLQNMASTLRATLSFERVVEAALDVCALALEEMDESGRTLTGAIFLFDQEKLVPVAARSFIPHDLGKRIAGKKGIIGDALRLGEPAISHYPREDPELRDFPTFHGCKTVICVPLRTGFQIFGAMVIGTEVPVDFTRQHLDLFNSVADHAVIALQNAKLYQDLKTEKQRIIEADEDARKELARDLHDGPTQSVAAIAMRVNFIRSILKRSPEQAIEELEKVEQLARETSDEIRGMLFTLRPLVLETEGLAAAILTVTDRLRKNHSLPVRFEGAEASDLLDEHAQSVVFSIVEEALSNARKYSEASQVEVRFWRERDLFVAEVRDDGVGFNVKSITDNYSARGSLGMVNMRERAERVDGSLRINSEEGKGTSVTLVVPLDRHGSRREGWRDRSRARV